MLHANHPGDTHAPQPDYDKERRKAEKAARLGVLEFYVAEVPAEMFTVRDFPQAKPPTAGSNNWTILSMQETRCPNPLTPDMVGRYGDYAIFQKPNLTLPIPVRIGSGQLAVWRGKLVTLELPPIRLLFLTHFGQPSLHVAVENFTWFSSMGSAHGGMGIWGGAHCNVEIYKHTKDSQP
jgi:hypothetical protein